MFHVLLLAGICRALLLGVYAATETFMLTDRSSGFVDTWAFLDRRLADAAALGQRAGESLAVAQATAGGAASIALAALEIFRPAIVAGGAVVGAGISAAEAAARAVVQPRGGAGDASGSGSSSPAPGMDINIAGIPLGTIMSAAAPLAPVASAAVSAVEGISRTLGVPLPPMVQVLLTAIASPAAAVPGAAPSFGGASSGSGSSGFGASGSSVGAGRFPLPPLPSLPNLTSNVASGLQGLASAAAAPGSPLASLAGVGNSPWVQVRGGRPVGETYSDADVRPKASRAPASASSSAAQGGAAAAAVEPAVSAEAVAAAAGLRGPSGPRLS